MRRSVVAAASGAALFLLAACAESLRAKFPTEPEVRAKLYRGMTAEEVLAIFGEPPGHHWVDVKRGGKVHYIAPVAARIRPEEGYAGFTVYFDRGTVWDWEVIRMNPSYEHRLVPFQKSGWVIAGLGLLGLGFSGYVVRRRFQARREEQAGLRVAFAASDIPELDLPPDFRFINHGMTLQAVIDQAGPYSRLRKIACDNKSRAAELVAYEYELPGRGGVLVLPEAPHDTESRIRAVYYRRPRSIAGF